MRSADVRPREHVPLAPLTTLGVGGAARWYVRAADVEQVRAARGWAADRGLPVFVLGGGSNIVVADAGFPGLVLHVAVRGMHVHSTHDEALVDAGAAESWDALVARLVAAGFAGVECLSGIPGSIGGTPIQNVGAYGQEVRDTLTHVTAVDATSNDVVAIAARDCGFSYRQSRFKQQDAGRFTVCRVAFALRRGPPTVTYPDVMAWVEAHRLDRPTVEDVRRAVLEIRRRKGMVLDPDDSDTRSVGSFFMNPVVPKAAHAALDSPAFPMPGGGMKIPAAWLIERAGFARGFTLGRAGLSSKHPLAIVNRGGADAGEVLDLACRVKRGVFDRFGVALRPEPVFLGFEDDARVHALQKANG